jgi:hypothetical protein
MRRIPAVAASAIGTMLVSIACSSAPATTAPPATSRAEAPAPDASAAVPEVLDFQAPLLDGGTLDGASLAGRDVAFWFWAPW